MFTVKNKVIYVNSVEASEDVLQNLCSFANGVSGLLGYKFTSIEKPLKYTMERYDEEVIKQFIANNDSVLEVCSKKALPPPNANIVKFIIKCKHIGDKIAIYASKNCSFETATVEHRDLFFEIDSFIMKCVILNHDVFFEKYGLCS